MIVSLSTYANDMEMIRVLVDDRVTLDFARTLQKARLAKGLTQKELATVRMNRVVVASIIVLLCLSGVLY